MARPAKPVAASTGHTENAKARIKAEAAVSGGVDGLVAPEWLTIKQVEIFDFIINERKNSGIVCNLDVPLVANMAVDIDRIQSIETIINENPQELHNKDLRDAKAKYIAEFYRGCNELGMSPQSRAKLAISAVNAAESKTSLSDILSE